MKCFLIRVLMISAAIAMHSPARAAVFFADDFEDTTGPLPAVPDMPQAGSWLRISNESHVINAASPGAHGGSNYLWIDRPTLSQFGNVGTSDGATTPGAAIHAEFWMNIVEGYASFGLNTGPGNNVLLFQPLLYAVPDASNTIGYYVPASVNPNEFLPTGLTYINNVWQKYELDTQLGSSTVKLTVDGVSVDLNGPFGIAQSATIDAVYGLAFTPASGTGSFYVDDVSISAVPEPTSVMLIGITAVPLWRRVRKTRTEN